MGFEPKDEAIADGRSATGLSPERAAQIARENQTGAATVRPVSLETPNSFTKVDGHATAPSITNLLAAPSDVNQIEDCSKGNCTVNGKRYNASTDIPGNRPTPLLHTDGTPVLGPDGQPLIGPERVDLEKIATELQGHAGPLSFATVLLNFRHGGSWDFQRMATDD